MAGTEAGAPPRERDFLPIGRGGPPIYRGALPQGESVPFFRGRYKFLLIWTALCLLPMPALVGKLAAPIPPGCFEWCGLDAQIAGWLIGVISVIWLVVTLVAFWISTQLERRVERAEHRRTFSALAALGAGCLPLVVIVGLLGHDLGLASLMIWISFVLQVVAGRALAAGARFSPVRWAALWFMAIATLALASSPFLRLDNVYVNSLFAAFYVGLALLAIAAFREYARERPGLVLLAAGSLLAVADTVYSLRIHQSLWIAGFALPATAIGWMWIGVVLLRTRSSAIAPAANSPHLAA
jgi:hypothetical protein